VNESAFYAVSSILVERSRSNMVLGPFDKRALGKRCLECRQRHLKVGVSFWTAYSIELSLNLVRGSQLQSMSCSPEKMCTFRGAKADNKT